MNVTFPSRLAIPRHGVAPRSITIKIGQCSHLGGRGRFGTSRWNVCPRYSSQRRTGRVVIVRAVFVHSAIRLAHRISLHYILPGRRVLMTASRVASVRMAIVALCCIQLVLSALLYLEKRFGFTNIIRQTLAYTSTIDRKIVDMEQSGNSQDGMLRAILNKTRRNLSSMSTIDSSDDEEDSSILMHDHNAKQQSLPICPLCHGRGTIDYEGKLKHTNEPCPRCLGSGHIH